MTDEIPMIMWDGKMRITCVCCSKFLHERGLIEIEDELPLRASEVPKLPATTLRVYRLAPGVTQDACREAVRGRHG